MTNFLPPPVVTTPSSNYVQAETWRIERPRGYAREARRHSVARPAFEGERK